MGCNLGFVLEAIGGPPRILLWRASLGPFFSQLAQIKSSNLINQKDIEAVVCGVLGKKGIISLTQV